MRTVVVGAGAAGLWAALHVAERGPVTIVASDPVGVQNPDSSCCGPVILVDETAEHVASTDLARRNRVGSRFSATGAASASARCGLWRL